jgi:hypothetical protein
MSGPKDFTLEQLTAHNIKKDIYVTIHDKVYDVTNFIDEHPYVLTPLSDNLLGLQVIDPPASMAIRPWTLFRSFLLKPSNTMTL